MTLTPGQAASDGSTRLDPVVVPPPTEAHAAVISITAVAGGKRRNDVRVRMTEPWPRRDWELTSDEPPQVGGEETAPMPLDYFATGVVTCFMTQVRSFARARDVRVDALSVDGRFEWRFIPGPNRRDPYTAAADVFRLDIDLQTPSSLEDQRFLIAAAARGCFAEAALSVPVLHRLRSGDDWITCEVD